MTFAATILAAAADASQFGFDGGSDQWWTDILASALSGLVQLPPAFLFVWVLHRFNLDRWLVLNGLLATVFSVVATSLVDLFVAPIFLYAEQVLEMIGVYRFMYVLMPNLLVCFVGASIFGWWLKHRQRQDVSEVFI